MKKFFSRLLLKATHRFWNRRISRVLCRAYMNGVINSHQLHELTAKFDPTNQHCEVNHIVVD